MFDEPGALSLPLISYSSSKPRGKSPPRGNPSRRGNCEELPSGGVPYGVPGPRDAGLGLESAALRSVDSRIIRAVFRSRSFWFKCLGSGACFSENVSPIERSKRAQSSFMSSPETKISEMSSDRFMLLSSKNSRLT